MLTLSEHAVRSPKTWLSTSTLVSLLLILLVALPSINPNLFSFLNPLNIDTDPENMLPKDEPVRVFHNDMKAEFGLNDIIVVGIVNESNPNGVFNVKSLTNIYDLAKYAKSLTWEDEQSKRGVIGVDIIAPSTVDNIEQGELGSVRFEWLMSKPPITEDAAQIVAQKAAQIPFLNGTMISDDAQAIALYIPIAMKDDSYRVAEQLRERMAQYNSDERYYLTGLPIAQDQFGVEMFIQMAISAPMAMLLIFILMWWFFRNVRLVIAPLIVAMISVIITMGLLVLSGNTVHIMSSMIPIFIMPIAVLDSVHILSVFFDRYPIIKDKRKTLTEVMSELSTPMLFTTITTCAGFASLVFTPIPPVQIFGIFVAVGVFLAWLLTITLVPAYIVLMPEKSLENFGTKFKGSVNNTLAAEPNKAHEVDTKLSIIMQSLANLTLHHGKLIFLLAGAVLAAAVYGINKIQINDNPVKWFSEDHSIRVADKVLNERFAGTYMAYLALEPNNQGLTSKMTETIESLKKSVAPLVVKQLQQKLITLNDLTSTQAIAEVINFAYKSQDATTLINIQREWDVAIEALERVQQEAEYFKQPKALKLIEELQKYLQNTGLVGKSNALPDIVKTVHRELHLGQDSAFRIPDTRPAIAQTLLTFQSSHRPQDLWHFVTPDYRKANVWIQLKSGDNRDMNRVVDAVNEFFESYPGNSDVKHQWFGLTYINAVWQDRMVSGMLKAFLSSFLIVLIMMTILFRSLSWGILCMLPLTITIVTIYGVIGLIGKDYDMPVAVLSALSLGLAVDYAIHFLARSRYLYRLKGSWDDTIKLVFRGPANAIFRNLVIIGVGFVPLLAAPLIPYQTVGIFISSILVLAGAVSLLVLPATLSQFKSLFFKSKV